MSEQAMVDAGIEVKVEDYDGTYVCLFCGESVRGQPALKCSHCSSNPFHLACVALAHSKYAEVCPTCERKTVEAWERASGGSAGCLLYTSPSPRYATLSRMPSSA